MIYCRNLVQAYRLVGMYQQKSQMLQTAPARMRTSLKIYVLRSHISMAAGSSQINGLIRGILLVCWTNCPLFLLPDEMLAIHCTCCYLYVLYSKSITCKWLLFCWKIVQQKLPPKFSLSCSLQLLQLFVSVISQTSHRNLIDLMKSRWIQGGEEDGGGRREVPPKDADAMISVDPVGDSRDAGCREGVCIPFKKQSKK